MSRLHLLVQIVAQCSVTNEKSILRFLRYLFFGPVLDNDLQTSPPQKAFSDFLNIYDRHFRLFRLEPNRSDRSIFVSLFSRQL